MIFSRARWSTSNSIGVDSRRATVPLSYRRPSAVGKELGTIVVDVVNTRTDRLVWRGWAQDPIDV